MSTNKLANISKQNFVSQVRSAGFEPSPATLHMLVDSFGNGGEPEQLRQCLRDWEILIIIPTSCTSRHGENLYKWFWMWRIGWKAFKQKLAGFQMIIGSRKSLNICNKKKNLKLCSRIRFLCGNARHIRQSCRQLRRCNQVANPLEEWDMWLDNQ